MERDSVHSYKYFNVSVYVPVHNVNEMTDFQEFDKAFSHLEKNIRIGRVYIENFRGEQRATEEQLLRVKDYFEKKGIAVSGGLTPVGVRLPGRDGSVSLCYSKPYDEEKLLRAVEMNARLFE